MDGHTQDDPAVRSEELSGQRGPGSALGHRTVQLAARWVQDGRRLDVQALAAELGVSRVTLFRNVGNRTELLAEALCLLSRRSLDAAEARATAEAVPDELRTVGLLRHTNRIVSTAMGLRRLLDEEPALAIRVLTDPRGRVQPVIVERVEEALRHDQAERDLAPLPDPGALAFALVRLGESFLYADVLAARSPDVATADRLQRVLVEAALLSRA